MPSVIPFFEVLFAGMAELFEMMWDGIGIELQGIAIGGAFIWLTYRYILRPFFSSGSDTVRKLERGARKDD